MQTLSERLLYALSETGISQAELARRINVKRQAIQYLCTANTNKSKFAYDIADALDISVDWLVAGKGNMLLKDTPELQLIQKQTCVPILTWDQIDAWLKNKLTTTQFSRWTMSLEDLSDQAFGLKLKNNSMYPRFDQSTEVIIDPNVHIEPPCFVLAYIEQLHEIVFRRLSREDDQLVLYAYNEAGYRKLLLNPNDRILGSMIEAKWVAQLETE